MIERAMQHMQQSLFGSLLAQPQEAAAVAEANLNSLLHETVFTVIDLETTGLNAKKNAITEVTAIQFVNGVEKAKYSTLVKPTESISEEVVAITGITDEMVQNAPPLISVMSELCGFVGSNPVIVGHNVGFDIKFLQEKLLQSGLHNFAERFNLERALCTKVLAVKAMPGLPSYEGMVVATACNVINDNPHRAEHDVRMSAGILFAIIEKLKGQSGMMRYLEDLLTYQGTIQ